MGVLTDVIYGGANAVTGLTEGAVKAAITKYGTEKEIAFPDSAYYFPGIYAATGIAVKKLGDLIPCVAVLKSLITNKSDLGQALNAGLATAIGSEILEGLKYLEDSDPYAGESGTGFLTDTELRALASEKITGMAIVLGEAKEAADVVAIVKTYREKGLVSFLVGGVIEQCAAGGLEMGMAQRVIPLGHDKSCGVHMVSAALRTALMFGHVEPGDLTGVLEHTRKYVHAFVNTFGTIDAMVVSAGAGAVALGFPVVVDIDLAGHQVPGALESICDHAGTAQRSLELCGIC